MSARAAAPASPVTVHLVDASPYIFRAHFSLPSSLKDPRGARAGAIYGFAGFLLKLIADDRPTHLGVAFDRDLTGSFFRNQLYADYKSQRAAPPAELVAQLAGCEEMATVLGAATFIHDHYEADDLIATLCGQLTAAGHSVVVVTSDKDFAQLVGDRVQLYDFGKKVRYDAAAVAAAFGVRPDQIVDLLALAGDPVDNIPGVSGIGRKSAAELLAAYKSLADLYARLEELRTSRLRGAKTLYGKLRDGRASAFLSRRLATLAGDAPVRADLERLAYRGADHAAAAALFERLGFKHLGERLPENGAGPGAGGESGESGG
jgi:DNA polymerase-1